jgi:hypothetical protein
MFRLSTAGGVGDLVFGGVLVAGALYALFRVLTSGVHILPSGLIIRELTRSTRLPWDRHPRDQLGAVRPVPRVRSGAHGDAGRGGSAVGQPPGVPPLLARRVLARRSSKGSGTDIAVDILGSYSAPVAQRRADELAAARKALSRRRA